MIESLRTVAKTLLPRPIQPFVLASCYSIYRKLLSLEWWILDHLPIQPALGLPLPPAKLRFRVGECASASVFFRVGQRTSENIRTALQEAGSSIREFRAVLDFGCGCGRTLLWLCSAFPEVEWQRTDVDREAVQWCRENISKATFAVNGPLPPLSYPDATFDFVHRISVFTHLSEQFQFAWIPELHRVLKPDGLLLLTSYSEHLWRRREDAAAVERKGCVFRTSTKLQGIVPEWYHTAFQSREHLMKILKNRKFTSPK